MVPPLWDRANVGTYTVPYRPESILMSDPLLRLRRICTALPEVEERTSHGEPAWFIEGKKQFVTFAQHHHDDRVAFWCAAPEESQRILVEAQPEWFFVPPYVGGRGWVGVYLDRDTDWDDIEEMVSDAYVTVAPPRLAAQIRGG
jgi:hypothetical protein